MPDEEKMPKKAARKRVVKKGVRGSRAPRKKVVAKEEEDVVEAEMESEAAVVESEAPEVLEAPVEGTVTEESESSTEAVTEIKVVEESSPEVKRGKSKRGNPKKKEADATSEEERLAEEQDDLASRKNRRGRNHRGGSRDREEGGQKRPLIDKNEAALKAWEIYQGELEEEGVSLVDSQRARGLARRCLDLATVFCEERDRYLER